MATGCLIKCDLIYNCRNSNRSWFSSKEKHFFTKPIGAGLCKFTQTISPVKFQFPSIRIQGLGKACKGSFCSKLSGSQMPLWGSLIV